MSEGWENYEPAPMEFFHGRLHKLFHEVRRKKVGQSIFSVPISGYELNEIIAQAKNETYAKYPKQVNTNAIKKSEL